MAILPSPRFSPELESRYQADLTRRVMPLGRIAAGVGAVLFMVLILWDRMLDPGSLSETVPIRITMSAVFLAALAFSYTSNGRRSIGPYMALHLTVGLGWPLILSHVDGAFVAGVPGEILAMIVVPILTTQLWQAAVALGILTIVPNLMMVATGATRFEIQQADYWIVSGACVAALLTYLMGRDRRRAFLAQVGLELEQRRSESLLLNILPSDIAERLKTDARSTSDAFDDATVIFADIAGFTDYAESVDAETLVEFLNTLFGEFDDMVAARGVEKIKTIGDSYMAVAGAPTQVADHADVAVDTARAMLSIFGTICSERGLSLELRVGLHSGPLIGGVIGKRKFTYDVWGDTVNVASRMESTGAPGRVQISEATLTRLATRPGLEDRGLVELKHHTPIGAYLIENVSKE